ncbi:MAG: alkaline phosphatase family protein [Actinomycetota bacterium]
MSAARSKVRAHPGIAMVLVGTTAAVAIATSAIKATPGFRGIHLIRHVIVVMQENRSFDNYFGTYPGAIGIPMRNGRPTVCVPDPAIGHCVRPFHDPRFVDEGGPHTDQAAERDIDGGRMIGFVRTSLRGRREFCKGNAAAPQCTAFRDWKGRPDAVGWHDAREIPNYWAYAEHFVLQDHMFAGVRSWSLPAHLDMVSGWSASCRIYDDPMSCHTNLSKPNGVVGQGFDAHPAPDDATPYAWTDLTYLLHAAGVSWKYYVTPGQQPDCDNDQMFCDHQRQTVHTPDIWNPLPGFETVHQDGQLQNIVNSSGYFTDAANGTLPAVSWIVPDERVSEHPPASIRAGQAWVTKIVNAAMTGPEWDSTAIFVSWDDWGGFYDNVTPPTVNQQGYGLRVPGLVISPYARQGFVDHTQLSTDSYLMFIEDDFLAGKRLDPKLDGRPDSRPFVAEDAPGLGNLQEAFDFSQPPRPPMLLPPYPPPGPASHTVR